jgi:hypothetical protein
MSLAEPHGLLEISIPTPRKWEFSGSALRGRCFFVGLVLVLGEKFINGAVSAHLLATDKTGQCFFALCSRRASFGLQQAAAGSRQNAGPTPLDTMWPLSFHDQVRRK